MIHLNPTDSGHVYPGDTVLIQGESPHLILNGMKGTPEHPIIVQPTHNTGNGNGLLIGRLDVMPSCEHVIVQGFAIIPPPGAPLSIELPIVRVQGTGNIVQRCRVWGSHGGDDWHTVARDGIQLHGMHNAAIDNLIEFSRHCIEAFGVGSRMHSNIYRNFCGDGLRPLADDVDVRMNVGGFVHAGNPQEHHDNMQCWNAAAATPDSGTLSNLTLHGNMFYNPPDYAVCQGGISFNGVLSNSSIAGNVIITNHQHGLTIASARQCNITGNIVAHSHPDQASWLMLGTNKPEHPACSENYVRDNLVQRFEVSPWTCQPGSQSNMTAAHVLPLVIPNLIELINNRVWGDPRWQ